MRLGLLGIAIPLLVLMLALSSPVGADDGVHGGALLHTAWPHTHGGGVARLSPMLHAPAPSGDPSVTAGNAAASELPGAGLTPPVPWFSFQLTTVGPRWQRPRSDIVPSSRREPPADRPPAGLLHV